MIKRPMTILVSSSRQWNPGDEFIWHGVKYLLEEIFGNGHNYILWNRNPDLFRDGWLDPNHKTTYFTNSCLHPPVDLCDLVVFAGTPEWNGPSVAPLYHELLRNSRVPALFLGLGLPSLSLQEFEIALLSELRSLVIARGPEAQALLQAQQVRSALLMPCPAFFSGFASVKLSRDINATVCPRTEQPRIGFVLQSSVVENQSISEHLVQDCLTSIKERPACDIICNYIDEWMRFSHQEKGGWRRVRYVFDALEYADLLRDYDVVISTRLHSAIHALSMGIPSCLVAEGGNRRIRDTASAFAGILPVFNDSPAAFSWALQVHSSEAKVHIQSLQASSRGHYLETIVQHLQPLI